MPKTKQQKQIVMTQFAKLLDEAKSVVFSTFKNISVQNQVKLRSKLRDAGVSYIVAKKTLLKKVLSEKGIESNEMDTWQGVVGVAVSKSDEIAPAKVLMLEVKALEGLAVEFGILEGNKIPASEVKMLAGLPGKHELIAQAIGAIRAPLSGLVNVFHANQRNFIILLNQIKDKKL